MAAKKQKRQRFVQRTASIADAINEAFSELQGLGEEVREVYDNMPESLKSGSRGETLSSTADTLESIDEPEVTELADGEVTWSEDTGKRAGQRSRACRRDNAVAALNAAKDKVAELAEEYRNDEGDEGDEEDDDDKATELEDLADALETLIGEAENCEFPGMFG